MKTGGLFFPGFLHFKEGTRILKVEELGGLP